MSQIIHVAQCLSITLVLVAAFATLSPAEPASARPPSAREVETACIASGGIYYEYWEYGDFIYGCWAEDGRELACYEGPRSQDCHLFPAPKPEPHIGDPVPNSSQPAGGKLVDQYSAAP